MIQKSTSLKCEPSSELNPDRAQMDGSGRRMSRGRSKGELGQWPWKSVYFCAEKSLISIAKMNGPICEADSERCMTRGRCKGELGQWPGKSSAEKLLISAAKIDGPICDADFVSWGSRGESKGNEPSVCRLGNVLHSRTITTMNTLHTYVIAAVLGVAEQRPVRPQFGACGSESDA